MRAWVLSLWKDLDAVGDPHVVFEDLLLRYSDGVREYHTLTHVQWGLARLEDMRRELGNTCGIDWQIVKFAYWFHDAIMDRSTDNEERSAELAKTVALKAGIAHMRALHAADLIRSTAHRTFPSEPDAAALVDADLSILGASSEAFDRYEHQVREEWSDVPEELFRKLRSDILTKFLERPTIYTSMYGQTHWESEAYANLERSIARLQCGVLP
jgi:predicted metal-dependent HD superfamily phosphohydrolase